jgi:hypothetical protein
VLAATVLGAALTFIDATVVNLALPRIGEELGAGSQALTWVVNAYSLSLAGLVLVGGALGHQVAGDVRGVEVTGQDPVAERPNVAQEVRSVDERESGPGRTGDAVLDPLHERRDAVGEQVGLPRDHGGVGMCVDDATQPVRTAAPDADEEGDATLEW